MARKRAVKHQVETKRVDGTIDPLDIVGRLRDAARKEARAAQRDPATSKEVEDCYREVHRLADALTAELERLSRVTDQYRRPGSSG